MRYAPVLQHIKREYCKEICQNVIVCKSQILIYYVFNLILLLQDHLMV